MKEVLVISPDGKLLRRLERLLQRSGYRVNLSESLLSSFLEVASPVPAVVLVDDRALAGPAGEAEQLLAWFHRCCPVVLLTTQENSGAPGVCETCLPRNSDDETVVAAVRAVQP